MIERTRTEHERMTSASGLNGKVDLQLRQARQARQGATALALAGVLFVAYPALRPFSDEVTLQGASAFGSMAWIVSHVTAVAAFILLAVGFLSLYVLLQGTSVEGPAWRSVLLSLAGIGLTLPFYGAEVFGLYAIGQEAIRQQRVELMELASVIRFGPGFLMIVVGLLLLGASTVFMAVAVLRTRLMYRWTSILLAAGFLLYVPQYMGSQPLRIAHGLLIAVGCIGIAMGMWRHTQSRP
ncbi:hypothetical protein [Paenibacillus sp. YYML68]|uniref:hypothetical protein n=1 Tax=Paenibacillus sp. YYML68 TaxID=2909250 RepID=UPI002492F181|nr:hypothetical protein [Paenibacillus sp. YYML68]